MTTPDDKRALSGSQAGMRFIALMKIYNDGVMPRLHQFITESYSDALLAEQDADQHTQAWIARRDTLGRHKVKQVLAAGKHQVAVVLAAEHTDSFYYAEVEVEDEYPHKITRLLHAPLQVAP